MFCHSHSTCDWSSMVGFWSCQCGCQTCQRNHYCIESECHDNSAICEYNRVLRVRISPALIQGVSSQTAVFISFVAPRWAWIFHQSQSGFDLETWDNHLKERKAISNFSYIIFLNFCKIAIFEVPHFLKTQIKAISTILYDCLMCFLWYFAKNYTYVVTIW